MSYIFDSSSCYYEIDKFKKHFASDLIWIKFLHG